MDSSAAALERDLNRLVPKCRGVWGNLVHAIGRAHGCELRLIAEDRTEFPYLTRDGEKTEDGNVRVWAASSREGGFFSLFVVEWWSEQDRTVDYETPARSYRVGDSSWLSGQPLPKAPGWWQHRRAA